MKKLFLFATAVIMFAACSKDATESVATLPDNVLHVSVGEDDSRIQLDENCHTVWNEGDMVSVFNKTTGNECWRFDGKTGDTVGTLSKVSGTAGNPVGKIFAVYPYAESNTISADGVITTAIPAVQRYCTGSYGIGSNVMAASGESRNLAFKNVLGWIGIQLHGTGTVNSIELKGNDGESLAGTAAIGEDLSVSMTADAAKSLTLDCGEGIALSSDPVSFLFAVVPQTFGNGITITVHYADGTIFEKSSDKTISVERNHIVHMADIDARTNIPDNEIWYTTTSGHISNPNANSFGADIISNTYENGKGIITFSDKVKYIGNNAFHNRWIITSITLPDKVESIGDDAFSDCTGLTSINIPADVASIGNDAFYDCSNLTNVTIPDSVTSIGSSAFFGCSNLTNIDIPNSVTSVGEQAFRSCGLVNVNIGNNVTSIGNMTFSSCTNLTSITIPDSVTSIGDNAFYKCISLTSIDIPNSVTTIGDMAFSGCENLTSVTVGDNVASIGDNAFYNCKKITGVYITDIANWCEISFDDWDSNPLYCAHLYLDKRLITDLVIPEGVTSIGQWAFVRCGITSVTIPSSVRSIGERAFADCSNIASIYCRPATPPALDSYAFYMVLDAKIYVPVASVDAYKSATNWSNYADKIVGYVFNR